MRHWFIFLAIVLVLLIGAAVSVQLVLRSDLPRRLALEAAQQQTGLRIEATSLHTGWGGRTRLEEVTVTLPLDEKPFLTIPRIEVRHNPLLSILLRGGSVRLDAVDVHEPHLTAQQRQGRWNLMDAAELLAQRDTDGDMASLPHVRLHDGRVTIITESGERAELAPLTFEGEPLGAVAWRFSGAAGEAARLTGRSSLSGDFAHEATLRIAGDEGLARLWGRDGQDVVIDATWSGRVEGESLRGRVDVRHLSLHGYEARGALRITTQEGEVALEPLDLRLTGLDAFDVPVILHGGAVRVRQPLVSMRDVNVAIGQSTARMNGQWSLSDATGDFEGTWRSSLAVSGDVTEVLAGEAEQMIEHQGTISATLRRPQLDQLALHVDLMTHGRSPWGDWDGIIRGEAQGRSWRDLTWRLTLPATTLSPVNQKPIVLEKLVGHGEVKWPLLVFEQLEVAALEEGEIHAAGRYNMETQQWFLKLDGRDLTTPQLTLGPLSMQFQAHGRALTANIESFHAHADRFRLTAAGSYDPHRDEALTAELQASVDLTQQVATSETEGDNDAARPQWGGRWIWDGTLHGSASDRWTFDAAGTLRSENIIINHHPLQDVQLQLTLQFKEDQFTITSDRFAFLDGWCQLAGSHQLGDNETQLVLETQDISLTRAARFANRQVEVSGTWHGSLRARLPHDEPEQMQVMGTVHIADFRAGPIVFDTMEGMLTTQRHVMRFDPVTLTLGDGRAEGSARFDLRTARIVHAELRSEQWPVPLEAMAMTARVDGRAAIDIDVIEGSIYGELDLQTQVHDDDRTVAELTIDGVLEPHQFQLNAVRGMLLSGEVEGKARIDLGDTYKSTGEMTFSDFAIRDLARWLPLADLADGRVSGELQFAPAQEARALEPLRVDVTLKGSEVGVRGVDFAGGHLLLYAGPRRVLVHESHFDLADGTVRAWASITRREGRWLTHVRSDFNELDLVALNRAVMPEADDVEGRLAGHLTFVGDVENWQRAVGSGEVRISESDLSNTNIIGAVVDALGIVALQRVVLGHGIARFRLEDGMLRIDRFRYFNRGVDITVHGVVRDVRMGKDSPILIFAGGTVRPLRDLPLPGARLFDEIFTNLQASVTSVRAAGTLAEPNPEIVPLSELSTTMRDLLTGPREVAGEATPE